MRLEPVARVVLPVLALTLAAALVAVLLGSGVPVAVLLAGALLITAPPAVWLLVRYARAQELEHERQTLAERQERYSPPAESQGLPASRY